MHKAIMKALEPYSFEFQLREAYGSIDGFEVNYYMEVYYTNNIHCQFSFYTTREKKLELLNNLRKLGLNKVEYKDNGYGIEYIIKSMSGLFNQKTTDTIMQINETIVNSLKEMHALGKDYSPLSGKEFDEDNGRVVKIPYLNFNIKLLNEEADNINQTIETANEEFKAAPNNYGKGFLGVLLATIIGLAMMAIFTFVFGIISAWAPIVAILLGSYFFKKFGGKPTWVMIVMIIVVNLVAMMGFMYILYNLSALGFAIEANYNPTSYVDALKYCMNNVEGFKASFTQDMLVTLLFCIIGFAVNIYGLIKSVKRVKNVN